LKKIVLISTILVLALLHYLSKDDLTFKMEGFMVNQLAFFRYLIIPIVAYFIANYASANWNFESKKEWLNSKNIFLGVFFLINSFAIWQHASAFISNKIINKEGRTIVNEKVVKLEAAGWGYECDSMTYKDYVIINDGYFPIIPKESSDIFLFDWYEFDARHSLEFNVPKQFSLAEFYKGEPTILKEMYELRIGEPQTRHKIVNNKYETIFNVLQYDTSRFKRYKWERSFE